MPSPTSLRGLIAGCREYSAAALSLNVLNEGLYITDNLAVAYAALLAPVALILLMNAFQPFFVLLIGRCLPGCPPSSPPNTTTNAICGTSSPPSPLPGRGRMYC